MYLYRICILLYISCKFKGDTPSGVSLRTIPPSGVSLRAIPPSGVSLRAIPPSGLSLRAIPPSGVSLRAIPPSGVSLRAIPPSGVSFYKKKLNWIEYSPFCKQLDKPFLAEDNRNRIIYKLSVKSNHHNKNLLNSNSIVCLSETDVSGCNGFQHGQPKVLAQAY